MKRGRICISVAEPDARAMAERVGPVRDLADVVEIRLDAMERPEVDECCRLIPGPLLFTNRPKWEGGSWGGSEKSRLAPLLQAVEHRADYVDFELRATPEMRQQLLDARKTASTRLIVSWHDFQGTPSFTVLEEIFDQMVDSGADIGKIVATARSAAEVIRLQRLLVLADARTFPLICFSMGEAGRISRFATLFLGGYMTYTCADERLATAPGQFTVRDMDRLCSLFQRDRE